jgi:hypothetical protein
VRHVRGQAKPSQHFVEGVNFLSVGGGNPQPEWLCHYRGGVRLRAATPFLVMLLPGQSSNSSDRNNCRRQCSRRRFTCILACMPYSRLARHSRSGPGCRHDLIWLVFPSKGINGAIAKKALSFRSVKNAEATLPPVISMNA